MGVVCCRGGEGEMERVKEAGESGEEGNGKGVGEMGSGVQGVKHNRGR
jgi:hypothetical protein